MLLVVSRFHHLQRVRLLTGSLTAAGFTVRALSPDKVSATLDEVASSGYHSAIVFIEIDPVEATAFYKKVVDLCPTAVVIGSLKNAPSWDDQVIGGQVVWVDDVVDQSQTVNAQWRRMVTALVGEILGEARSSSAKFD